MARTIQGPALFDLTAQINIRIENLKWIFAIGTVVFPLGNVIGKTTCMRVCSFVKKSGSLYLRWLDFGASGLHPLSWSNQLHLHGGTNSTSFHKYVLFPDGCLGFIGIFNGTP